MKKIKKKPFLRLLSVGLAPLILAACAQQPGLPESEKRSAGGLPNWVAAPMAEGGIADTQCVENNATISVLRARATALARAELARNIDVRVQAMDSTYARLTEADEGASSGTSFESVSRQVTNEKLAGSRVERSDFVRFPGGEQMLCVMVVMPPETTDALYQDMVSRSGRQLSAQDDAVLYEEFRAHQAQEAMQKEMQRQRGE